LSEPDEWEDILDEFEELVEEVADSVSDEPLDMDAQFTLQAEAMGIDLSGIDAIEIDEEDPEEAPDEASGDEIIAELEEDFEEPLKDDDEESDDELAIVSDDLDEEQDELETDSEPENLSEEVLDDEPDGEDFEDEDQLAEEIKQLDLIDDEENQEELIDEPIVESHTIENELAADDAGDETENTDASDSGEHVVPPLTEEEQTVNMQIDQDLMALAIEDDDGFASTIVIPEEDAEKKGREIEASGEDDDDLEDEYEERPGFETIIMEGEFVRSAMDSKKLAADAAAAAALADLARAKEAEEAQKPSGTRFGMIAGTVILVLMLAAQMIHQSREALATIPAFSNTVGQLYRAIGQPVQPAWDITGWRFEATKGSTEGEEEELTVYSRLGNNSDGPLPYPLIGISLTDRFEETIGSRVLDPAEYLPSDLDPRKLVEPGNTFNAVITIKSTSEEATGFKLNVCYRLSDGQLRCAIDDFK
jgi:hypothetical protein